MNTKILAGLLNNASLLLAMCLVYDTLSLNYRTIRPQVQQALTGAVLGVIGIAVMVSPWQWYPGIIFDTRSVLLSVSGLFFGAIPTLVAMGMTAAYRIHLGGNGVWVGVAVILASGFIGIGWRSLRKKGLEETSFRELFVFGIAVHLVMLGFMSFLPGPLVAETLVSIGIPVMLIYPAGTALLGRLMSGRHARRRTEEALRESEERWQFALEGSGDGVWDLDVAAGRVYYSHQWKRMLGFLPGEIGDTLHEFECLVHPEDHPRVMEEYGRHLRGEIPVYLTEFRIRCKDGTYKWILSRGKVMARDGKGNPLRVVGTHSDITEQKRLEEQLRQAQKMEAIGQLAGGVAHDFNNILTTIIGRIYLLRNALKDRPELTEHVEQVALAAERAAALTRSLLAFSREQTVELRRICLNDAVQRASGLIARLVAEDIEITYRFAEPGPVALVDEGRLGQVLMNLVANARDSISGPGRIEIATERVRIDGVPAAARGNVPQGDYAVVLVRDSGSGMDESTLAHIFEPFFTTKEVGKGTGLGLSMVYGIIRQHHGHIDVRSEPGTGTSFTLYLPLVEGVPEELDRGQDGPLPRGRGTILLAEDEDAVRAMMTTVLAENGFRVIEAVNGVDAVVKFTENRNSINAVLMDVIMPRMNGREACDEILKLRPDTKVLFMSGYSGDILSEKALLQEKNLLIHKPLRPREFILRLQEVLQPDEAPPAACLRLNSQAP
ncbi:MAG: response regulator [Deltaproteobacteria bacterium]|nr:response regulator [Deltaproteobacteria bacterium]